MSRRHVRQRHDAIADRPKQLFIQVIGMIWDHWAINGEDPGYQLSVTFWNSYFVEPWDIWCHGQHKHVPMFIPANQCVEAWFRTLTRILGGKKLRGSTRDVITNSLSKVLLIDDINAPDDLLLEAKYIHKNVLLKAQYLLAFPCKLNSEYWYKTDKIWVRRDAANNGKFVCAYVLSMSRGTHYKNLSNVLVKEYDDLFLEGNPPGGDPSKWRTLKSCDEGLKKMAMVAEALHRVEVPIDPEASCVPCRMNKMKLVCTCKGNRKSGVCAHVFAVNDLLFALKDCIPRYRCAAQPTGVAAELMRMDGKKKRHHDATGRREVQLASDSESEVGGSVSDMADFDTTDDGGESD